MKTLLILAVLLCAAPAVAGDMPGTFALEPFVRYGNLGEPTVTLNQGGETTTLKKFATGWTVNTGVRFIVPISTKLDVRGFAAVSRSEEKDRWSYEVPKVLVDEVATKRSGYDLGISVRYWIRLGD